MAQFLPRRPSTGEQFAKAFSTAATEIPQFMHEQQQQKQQKQAITNLSNADVANLPADLRKEYFANQFKMQEQQYKERLENQKHERSQAELKEKREYEEGVETKKQETKKQEELQKKSEKQAKLKKWFTKLRELKPATGFNPLGPLNRKRVQQRTSIDAIGSLAADYAYNVAVENKGALTNDKIEKLMKKYMISASDSERQYEGKLQALETLIEDIESGTPANQAFAKLEGKKQERPPLDSFYE